MAAAETEEYTLTFNSKHAIGGSLPNQFAVQMPSNIIPDLSMHLRSRLFPLGIEVENVFMNGINNIDFEAIYIRKIFQTDQEHQPKIDEVKLGIPADVYNIDGLLSVINLLGQDVFRLDKVQATNTLNLVGLIPDDELSTLKEAYLIMSHVLAAKLGFILPAFSNFQQPRPVSFSLMSQDCQQNGSGDSAPTEQAEGGGSDEDDGQSLASATITARGRAVNSSNQRSQHSIPSSSPSSKSQLLSVVNLPSSNYHFKTCISASSQKPTTSDHKVILARGNYEPNLYCNLGQVDLLIENDYMHSLPTILFSPSFNAKKGQAKLATLSIANPSQALQTRFLTPITSKKTWVDLKTSLVTFKLLDTCGALFPLDSRGETQITLKITKTLAYS